VPKPKDQHYYLISDEAASDVHHKVVWVKEQLLEDTGLSVNQACKEAGLSRSTYYKYRHKIYRYQERTDHVSYLFTLICVFNAGFLRGLADLLSTYELEVEQFNQLYLNQGQSKLTFRADFNSVEEAQNFFQALANMRGISEPSYRVL
jgi:chorismate mutase